jgi:hypothetical protein
VIITTATLGSVTTVLQQPELRLEVPGHGSSRGQGRRQPPYGIVPENPHEWSEIPEALRALAQQ